MENITQIIQSLGLPIALVIYFLWDKQKQEERQDKKDEEHKQEMDKMAESYNNLNLAIVKLTELLNQRLK